jgi:predicted transcriptional regulator
VVSRRSPDMIALDLLDCVEGKGKATKWDLIKVVGNEVQFTLWIERFFLPEKVLVEIREGRKRFYVKTERGDLFHLMLRNGNIVKLFSRVSGKRLS